MHIAIITEKIHEQTIPSVVERIKIYPEIFNPEHVFNKSTIIFQLATRLTKRQHNKFIAIAENKHLLVPLQLQSHRPTFTLIEKKDRQRHTKILQINCHSCGKDIDRLFQSWEINAAYTIVYWCQVDWGSICVYEEEFFYGVWYLSSYIQVSHSIKAVLSDVWACWGVADFLG